MKPEAVKQIILATHLQTPALYSVGCSRSSCFSAEVGVSEGGGQLIQGPARLAVSVEQLFDPLTEHRVTDLPPDKEPIAKLELGVSQRQPVSFAEA